jgi:PAS domain S-box-containing protein
MGIKKKLLTSFFTIIIVLLISEGFFIVVDYIILSKYTTFADNMISEYSLIDETSSLVTAYNNRIKSPIDKNEIDKFDIVYSQTKQTLTKLEKTIVDSGSRIAFNGLENNINDVFFNIEIGLNSLSSGNYLEATSRYEVATSKNSFVKDNVNSLLLKELEYGQKLQVEVEKVRLISQIIAIFLLIFTAGGSIWYAVKFSNKLVSPLIKLTKLAKVMGGNSSVVMDQQLLKGDDEISSLAHSFEMMVSSLRISISKLQEYNIEIKQSEGLLQIEKAKLQQYLDEAGIIVLIFDSSNQVSLINKKGEELLGVEEADAIGKDWVEGYVVKKDWMKTKNLLNFVFGRVSLVDTLENVIVAKDKSEKNIVWHFSLLGSQQGEAESMLATGVDVTELTKAKITINQLKEVDKLKNEVLNIATHELKTPLISIVGLSEVMEKKPETIPSEYQNYISIIHTEGLKLTNLIKTMLTANRNEIGKEAAVKEKFDLVALVKSLETSLGMLTKRTDSKVGFDLRINELVIESDKAKISQVIYNFVDNAVKYGPKNQTIEVNLLMADDKNVKVEVVGAGQGISEEMQKKLFMKFSQLEPSLSRSQDGMGLGLYICKQNIENLGGQIGVVSKINQGATFYFTLPVPDKKI